MKKYEKAVMEIVEIANNDIVTTSGGTNPNFATNYTTPGLPGMPGHGGSGNVGGECCN